MPRKAPSRKAYMPLNPRAINLVGKGLARLILERDGGCCVRCGVELNGIRGLHWSIHHRRPKAMGGSRLPDTDSPQNLISVCGADNAHGCHGFIHQRRSESMPHGWLLSNLWRSDPLQRAILVAHGARWVYLTDDGRYSDNPPEQS